MKWNKYKPYLFWIAIVEAVGARSGFISRNGMKLYGTAVAKPPLSPPGWVFPVVWSALYLLMGYASYRIVTSNADNTVQKRAITFYGIQLSLNFLWPLIFFGLQWYWVAFVLLILLWVFIYLTMRMFGTIDDTAENLLIPYLLWVTFAGYLNLGVALLN